MTFCGPGADPGAIRLTFEGVDQLEMDADGGLVLKTGVGSDGSAQACGLPGVFG